MYSKSSMILVAAAIVLLAGASVVRAGDNQPDARSGGYGLNEHQTQLDAQFASSPPTGIRGTPARPGTPYGYVPPHRPAAKHRHGINH